jgi:hypothetical protein
MFGGETWTSPHPSRNPGIAITAGMNACIHSAPRRGIILQELIGGEIEAEVLASRASRI